MDYNRQEQGNKAKRPARKRGNGMNLTTKIIKLIKEQTTPAMGCTEPIAVALAAARAAEIVKEAGEEVKTVTVDVDPNVFKNGLGVYVPRTGQVGLSVAAAIGAIGGKSAYGLEVLQDVTEAEVAQIGDWLAGDKIKIAVRGEVGKLHIEAWAYGDSVCGYAELLGKHDNFVRVKKNDEILLERELGASQSDDSLKREVLSHSLEEIVKAIEKAQEKDLEFLLTGAAMNMKVADAGLKNEYGLGVGAKMAKQMEMGLLGSDLSNTVTLYTAAASDARMHGAPLPVMTTSGSGNLGIVATLPVYVAARELDITGIKLLRAMAMAQVFTIRVKDEIGILSALCGCTLAAAIGSAIGIIYLYDGTVAQMETVVQTMVGDISGVICDGAKPSCALKVASGVATALRNVFLVLAGLKIDETNGIVGRDAEESFRSLGVLSREGTQETDRTVLKIMQDKL